MQFPTLSELLFCGLKPWIHASYSFPPHSLSVQPADHRFAGAFFGGLPRGFRHGRALFVKRKAGIIRPARYAYNDNFGALGGPAKNCQLRHSSAKKRSKAVKNAVFRLRGRINEFFLLFMPRGIYIVCYVNPFFCGRWNLKYVL
jgi:hypothetical protein